MTSAVKKNKQIVHYLFKRFLIYTLFFDKSRSNFVLFDSMIRVPIENPMVTNFIFNCCIIECHSEPHRDIVLVRLSSRTTRRSSAFFQGHSSTTFSDRLRVRHTRDTFPDTTVLPCNTIKNIHTYIYIMYTFVRYTCVTYTRTQTDVLNKISFARTTGGGREFRTEFLNDSFFSRRRRGPVRARATVGNV